MDSTRRHLLKAGMSAAAFAALPRPLRAHVGHHLIEPVPPIVDPDVKDLALRAIDAAHRAGATYADVRLTHTRTRTIATVPGQPIEDVEQMVVGVRAMVNGYWGFASGPVWTRDEMDRLGKEATHQASANTLGKSRVVTLASTPIIRDGHWTTPVEIDPFEVSPYEVLDFLHGLALFAQRYAAKRFPRYDYRADLQTCQFQVQEKAFASSEGSFCTQRLHLSEGHYGGFLSVPRSMVDAYGTLDALRPAGVGWELYSGQPLRDYIMQLMDELDRDMRMLVEPVAVGRFDTVFHARAVAELVHHTIGPATELDRALGYEANATGTSYINDPIGTVGNYEAGASAVTLMANRTERGGAATVQWDDEGVAPDDCVLIKDGVVVDFQTTRESASWLADRYHALSVPVRSHGHANAPSALEAPLQHTPNLRLASGKEAHDLESLITGMTKGIAIEDAVVDMDQQVLNGEVSPKNRKIYRVSQGKRVARIVGSGMLFRSPELWKGLLAIGGTGSERRYGLRRSKGEPEQTVVSSVTAPPALFKQVTLIEAGRKS